MNTPLHELMWDMHRAEGSAAIDGNTLGGSIPDIRQESEIEITLETREAYNCGAIAGICAFMDHLNESGYKLLDPKKEFIGREGHATFTDAFKHWLQGDAGFSKE